MALVDYSDSDDEQEPAPPPAKKRKGAAVVDNTTALPALPAAFRDLYSSTVRTSTQDDPSLHGGRKRVTPHATGHWPAHVYLEWFPSSSVYDLLSSVLTHVRLSFTVASTNDQNPVKDHNDLHSLLENELGVCLALHVSLSRPLSLKTNQKDAFLAELKTSIAAAGVRSFSATPLDLIWHPNEDRSRWFLVLRLRRPSGNELRRLLKSCNALAAEFKQSLLYNHSGHGSDSLTADEAEALHDSFHISIAWSLHPPGVAELGSHDSVQQPIAVPLRISLEQSHIKFEEVKARIGQDVATMLLRTKRSASSTP